MVCSAGSAWKSFFPFVRIAALLCVSLLASTALRVSLAQAPTPSAQSTQPKKTPQDANTPPAEQILSSYEGQSVTSVEIAGRPDLKTSDFQAKLMQKEAQPFSHEKIDTTVAALKSTGQFQNVRVQVEPLSNGLRVLFILDPAVYYGIFQFPGAEKYAYSRLIQVSNYTSQTPY